MNMTGYQIQPDATMEESSMSRKGFIVAILVLLIIPFVSPAPSESYMLYYPGSSKYKPFKILEQYSHIKIVDGQQYMLYPPTRPPRDDRYFLMVGRIESELNNMVICQHPENYSAKWAFSCENIRPEFIPHINQEVIVIGKIIDVVRGSAVLGHPLFCVLIEAVIIKRFSDGKLLGKDPEFNKILWNTQHPNITEPDPMTTKPTTKEDLELFFPKLRELPAPPKSK
jgi:hypothetical protein